MIVQLAALKLALGIDEDDTSQDALLTALETRLATWVQEQTHRVFTTPAERVEYRSGSGARELYITGHLDVATPTDDDILIEERPLYGGGDWTTLVLDEDYEVRNTGAILRADGWPWSRDMEYRITYEDGYTSAPQDVQELVIELVQATSTALSDDGVTAENIGDYSYQIGGSGTSAYLTDTGFATLKRWKRIFA